MVKHVGVKFKKEQKGRSTTRVPSPELQIPFLAIELHRNANDKKGIEY